MQTQSKKLSRSPLIRPFARLSNSISKRLFWRSHLADAIEELQSYKKELVTPEMMLAVPLVFKGKGYYRSLELKQNMGELLGLVKELEARQLENICEIGTFKGGTLFVWVQLASDTANIYSIDLPGGAFGGGYSAKSLDFFKSFAKGQQNMECIRGDSHKADVRSLFESKLGENKLDFLFIDGDHSYLGVKQDFEDYSPYVKQGGVIAFHDIVRRQSQPDIEVWKFWNEIKEKYTYKEFIETGADRRTIGIGMITK